MSKQDIYDNDAFFEYFKKNRGKDINFNDCIETPIILSMLPDIEGKRVLDIGCGMGQHARQYAELGASSVYGIDISEKMLAYAKEHNSASNITYRRMAMEDLDQLTGEYDLITSSLAFDYAEDLKQVFMEIHRLLVNEGIFLFSMSHPMATAWDGVYDRYTRTETGERLYANIRNYLREGQRTIKWVVDEYELYHRTFSTLINAVISAGFVIEECQESRVQEELLSRYPDIFGGIIHRPDFIFFRCRKV